MRYVTLLVLCLTASGAQSAGVDRIDIMDYGLMSGPAGVRDGVSSGGIEHRSSSGKMVQTTTSVPACIGTRFGIMFSVIGAARGTSVNLTEVYKFPQSGLHKPDVPFPLHESRYESRHVIGTRSDGIWYEFDDPWEIVTGDWTLELRDGNRVLASKTFSVVTPKKAQCPGLTA